MLGWLCHVAAFGLFTVRTASTCRFRDLHTSETELMEPETPATANDKTRARTPQPDDPSPGPSEPRRSWAGALAILAIVCGLLAWGNGMSAVGTVPGDFGKAVVLTCGSLLLSTAALFRLSGSVT